MRSVAALLFITVLGASACRDDKAASRALQSSGGASAGVDRAAAFSLDEARLLSQRYGISWSGVYIGGACNGGSGYGTALLDEQASQLGWRFLPTYVGQQAPAICGASTLTAAQGSRDADDAAQSMARLGWAPSPELPVALDVEAGTFAADTAGTLAYVDAWTRQLAARGYLPYVYASPSALSAFAAAQLPIAGAWSASYYFTDFVPGLTTTREPDLAAFADARAWQYAGNVVVGALGQVDFDSASPSLKLATRGGARPPVDDSAMLAVARNGGAGLEAFARAADGSVWHTWQLAGGGWSDGEALAGATVDALAVGQNADGRLELFARGSDGAIVHRWQLEPAGGWSAWASLGGSFGGAPRVASDGAGHLHVLALGSDGALQQQGFDGASWPGWQRVGSIPAPLASISTATDGSGAIHVVARDQGGALWHLQQLGGSWDDWLPIGVTSAVTPSLLAAGGVLAMFTRDARGAVVRLTWNGAWSAPLDLGGAGAGALTAALNGDGRSELFTREADGSVSHSWEVAPGAAWSSWAGLGGELSGATVAGSNSDGRLELFGRGAAEHALVHAWQTSGGWSAFYTLGGAL